MSSPLQSTRRVEFRDTDAAGIVHFSVFFAYMEEAEHQFWRHLGISVKQEHNGEIISWPRVAAHCDYQSPARFEDELTISVCVDAVGGKSVTFAFEIACGEREIASGKLTAVCCRIPNEGPPQSIAIPDEIRAKLDSS